MRTNLLHPAHPMPFLPWATQPPQHRVPITARAVRARSRYPLVLSNTAIAKRWEYRSVTWCFPLISTLSANQGAKTTPGAGGDHCPVSGERPQVPVTATATVTAPESAPAPAQVKPRSQVRTHLRLSTSLQCISAGTPPPRAWCLSWTANLGLGMCLGLLL